jgi:hypothetical protein
MQDTNSSCNICFDEFQLDEEVIRVPCTYVNVYQFLLRNLLIITLQQAHVSYPLSCALAKAEWDMSRLVCLES